ncbi:MAG TPA: WD40 repeat domain-containing protein [Gemmataceae bacterium]|nr:WD40 repeat domain-containing protein [Gemmataceae bacterium]
MDRIRYPSPPPTITIKGSPPRETTAMAPARFAIPLLIAISISARGQVVPTDAAGDPLPPGAVARIGTLRFLPRGFLHQVFFTSDGSTVIGRGGDNVIDFWDAETGKPVGEFRDPDLMNFWIDQSPDGKFLALYGHDRRGLPAPDTALRLYDLASRKVLWTSVDDEIYVPGNFRVRFSPDGKKLITGSANDVRVWDAATGKELVRHKARIEYPGFAFSADGKTLAFGDGNTGMSVWAWESTDPPRQLPLGVRSYFNALAFSADGKTIYASSSAPVAMAYDIATGKYLGGVDESLARWRAVSPDGKTLAIADFDKAKQQGSVVLREVGKDKEIGRLPSGPHMIGSACWSKDGRRLAGATAYRAWVWDVKTGKAFGPDVPRHEGLLTSLALASDGRLLTASEDGTVRAWDSTTGKQLLTLTPAKRPWAGVVLSPDGDLLAGSNEPNAVRVWDAKTGREVYKLAWGTGRTGGVLKVRFTADGQTLLTYGHDFYLRAFDTLTGKLKVERKFRPAVFGPETDDERVQFQNFYLSDHVVDLTPDGGTLVIGAGKDVSVYAADTGKERFKFEGDPRHVTTVVLSPDGKRLAVSGYGPAPTPAAAVAMMGRVTPVQVTVWDLEKAQRLAQVPVPAGVSGWPVVAFSPDGKQLVTGSGDEVLRFWDAGTGRPVGQIELPRPATRVAFGGDKRLAVGFTDPTVVVYDLAKAMQPAKKE